jgi:hypothetical protein
MIDALTQARIRLALVATATDALVVDALTELRTMTPTHPDREALRQVAHDLGTAWTALERADARLRGCQVRDDGSHHPTRESPLERRTDGHDETF